jgi:hypothetical protein
MRYFFNLLIYILAINTNCFSQVKCIDSSQIDKNSIFDFCSLEMAEYNPVCGCDSISYINGQCAYYHGITDGRFGACKCIDSTRIDTAFYNRINKFKAPEPVCGCDGRTYRDAAEAWYKFGVLKVTKGPCECIVNRLIDTVLVDDYLRKFQGSYCKGYTRFPTVCGCDSNTYIDAFVAVHLAGVMNFKNGVCPCILDTLIDNKFTCSDDYSPVCGCDSITYKNACVAEKRFGISRYKPGKCQYYKKSLQNLAENCLGYPRDHSWAFPVCGADSITYFNECEARCYNGVQKILFNGPCFCPDVRLIDTSYDCRNLINPICGCDGKTYVNDCVALKKFGIQRIGSPIAACKCKDTSMINKSMECYERLIYNPVCGCDNRTYRNPCEAFYHYGIGIFQFGVCRDSCLDLGLIDSSRYCLNVYEPVCGCDKVTYTNECVAKYKYGVSKWTPGRCLSSISNTLGSTFQVIPNPFVDKISVVLEDENLVNSSYQIVQITGQIIMANRIESSYFYIDGRALVSGIYFLRILKDGKLLYTKKIIKL